MASVAARPAFRSAPRQVGRLTILVGMHRFAVRVVPRVLWRLWFAPTRDTAARTRTMMDAQLAAAATRIAAGASPDARVRLGLVELGRAHAEVCDEAVDLASGEHREHFRSGRAVKLDAVTEGREALTRALDGRGISVDADDLSVGPGGFENGLGVSAESEGDVDVETAPARRDQLDHALAKDRDVKGRSHAPPTKRTSRPSPSIYPQRATMGGVAPDADRGRW